MRLEVELGYAFILVMQENFISLARRKAGQITQ
jgi:hypothetical protein